MQSSYENIVRSLQTHFDSGKTKPLAARLAALDQLEKMIRENIDVMCSALKADLRKPKQEALVAELAVTLEEIHVTQKNLKKWMRPQKSKAPWTLWPSRNRIYSEPLGVVLIIAPWNYPVQLALAPLIGAIAAGNCVVLKPSELVPHTSQMLAQLIGKYFSADYIHVVEGGVAETTALLQIKWDHIFFTGSTPVGKIIMQAASKNLVPVTLELGGKSPTIVCEDADLDLAARRIVWGKFYNAGQTCVAPDYLYAHETIADRLTEKIKNQITEQFGADPKISPDFARIVNRRNWERVVQLIDSSHVRIGGDVDGESLYISPTVLRDISWSDKVMGEEIFGPVLPLLTFHQLSDVFQVIRSRPKPLAAYLFSSSNEKQKAFIDEISFGGGCVNDVLVHLSNPYLPFGGVGDSGMGRYHGIDSFKTFSHAKSVMVRTGLFDLSARYAPYSDKKLNFLKRLFGL